MREQRRIWHVAGMVGIAVVVCALMGCDGGSGRLAMEDPNNVSDVVQGPQASADEPSPAVEGPAPTADGEDAISQRIDELFALLEAKVDENKDLLETIAELERNVRILKHIVLAAKGEGADCSPFPSRPERPSLPERPSSSEGPSRPTNPVETPSSGQPLPPRPPAGEGNVAVSLPQRTLIVDAPASDDDTE